MGRIKGTKNKTKKSVKVVDEVKDVAPLVPGPEACHCESKNPLIGYTLDEVKVFVSEVNPSCGRGGCLHLKEFHLLNTKGKLECHLCSCVDFS